MLEVIFYQTTDDLTKTGLAGNPLIICPSPTVADGLRRFMPENSEIITISKWVSDYLKNKNLKRSNKAELMLRLSSVWRHYFPTEEAHLFFKSFELFTDLRSSSLELEMLSEFLKEVDEVTTKSVLLFWTFLQNEKLIDEHLSYQILSEMDSDRPLWIMGFKHLSGIQIDMLKTIGEQSEVVVFFPKDVYAETLSSDWIRWLVPEVKLDLSLEAKTLNIIHFPKNKLNIVLDALKRSIPHFDLSLASQNLTLNLKQEVSTENLFFKSQEDIFTVQRESLIGELGDELFGSAIPIETFCLKLEERKAAALKDENFILYKVLLLLNDALLAYTEFQTTVDLFSLKVFKMILQLNSPRVSLLTLNSNPDDRLFELNELPYREGSRPLFLIATSNYGPLKSSESKYSEKMMDALKAVAPVKRAGLDFLYLKSELNQTLSKKETVLLIEEGLELIDLSWREILNGFELVSINSNANYQLKKPSDFLSLLIRSGPYELKNISASRLQQFADCPRKYYFSYVEKLDHRPEERLKIAPDEMGTIEHKIIEHYFEGMVIDQAISFDNEKHKSLCLKCLDVFLNEHRIVLNEKNKLTTFYELLHYTKNGIEFLIGFCDQNKASKIEFEAPLGVNPWGLVGAIDCLVTLPNDKKAMFDFKRSAAAIGSKRDTQNFEKIQIWVYLLILQKHKGSTIHTWGYLNLSEIEVSQIYHEEETPLLSDKVMMEFQAMLETLIVSARIEVNFQPKPRNNKICLFCEVELFCTKGSCL